MLISFNNYYQIANNNYHSSSYKYNFSICSREDEEAPIIIPPIIKEEITDKMTIANTAPMLITLFMIFSLLGIHNPEVTLYSIYIEKMIYLYPLEDNNENKSCFE